MIVGNTDLKRTLVFKKCRNCGFEWPSRQDFLDDPMLEIVGYQAHFEELTAGLFLFNHSCHGTLAVPAGHFKDLYDGPVFTQRAAGTKECPGHCLHEDDLDLCPVHCECNYVREIIQTIRHWPKGQVSAHA